MLKRSLGPWQIQLISLGGIVGSGYFLGVGATLSENGPSTLLAYLLGGLIVWLVAMAMGELSVAMPREGSFVSHCRELLGRHWAAGVGWSYWLNWCAYIPSEMVAGGLILHLFFPSIPVMVWASCFGLAITLVNVINVRHFGHVESLLALVKIAAIGIFTATAAMVWMGATHEAPAPELSLGQLLPDHGALAFLATMVLVLVNFQGTELIALSAAEARDPERSIPRAARNVALRAIALYVLPLTLLLLVYPWQQAGVESSVFVDTLALHGFGGLATFFQIVIVTAALSCANSGLYGAVRALYGLGKEGLAPSWLTRLNAQGVPARATYLTFALSWAFLPLYLLFEDSAFYTWLLSVSGFTGAICWISISYCQLRLRRRMARSGAPRPAYAMPAYPLLGWSSIALQLLCLGMVAWHATLRSALILGVPAFVLPAAVSWWRDQRARGVAAPTTSA